MGPVNASSSSLSISSADSKRSSKEGAVVWTTQRATASEKSCGNDRPSSGTARLGDFGAARLEGDSHGTERTGHTPRYAAPERRRGMAASRESDVYGYGATMLAVLPDGRSGVPRRTRRLLRRCVRTDPERRPDAPTVARAMSRR